MKALTIFTLLMAYFNVGISVALTISAFEDGEISDIVFIAYAVLWPLSILLLAFYYIPKFIAKMIMRMVEN